MLSPALFALAATAGLNVVKSIYMEVDVDPAQQPMEAEYVIDLCQRADNPMTAAVISGRPASEGFAKYITAYKGSAYIKAIRSEQVAPRVAAEAAGGAGVPPALTGTT